MSAVQNVQANMNNVNNDVMGHPLYPCVTRLISSSHTRKRYNISLVHTIDNI